MNSLQHHLKFSNLDPAIKGFQEVIFSVSNLDKAVTFYKELFGWNIVYKGNGTNDLKKLWHLNTSVNIKEALLVNPEDNLGVLRLVSFKNVEQEQIRSGTQIWDSGGIFDINVRVKDINSMYKKLQKEGWNGYTDPKRFTFGKFDVSEVLVKGPDGITIAMMQRFNPPLEGFEFKKVSRIFNSTTICRDYKTTLDFFINKLGFKLYYETEGTDRSHGSNVIGVPPNINGDITVPVCIIHPNGENDGSLELLETIELKGKDCSALAKPPNLGILMYRFPVRNADAYASELIKKGVILNSKVHTLTIEPYGQVKIFSVLSPDGVWIEFIQLI